MVDPEQPKCEKFKSHYLMHGVTALLALVDAMIIAVPVRVAHALIPTALVFIYVAFTYVTLILLNKGPMHSNEMFHSCGFGFQDLSGRSQEGLIVRERDTFIPS